MACYQFSGSILYDWSNQKPSEETKDILYQLQRTLSQSGTKSGDTQRHLEVLQEENPTVTLNGLFILSQKKELGFASSPTPPRWKK